jgi:hypothetical protein
MSLHHGNSTELGTIKSLTGMKNNAEVTVAHPPNQGTMKETGCNRFFLGFSLVTSLFQDKESDKRVDGIM